MDKIYYIPTRKRIALLLFGFIITLISIVFLAATIYLFLSSTPNFKPLLVILLFISVFLGVTGLFVVANVRLMRLTLTKKGIEYQTYWYKIYADWRNVGNATYSRFGIVSLEAITLHEPVRAIITLPLLSSFFRKDVDKIPISAFGIRYSDIIT